MPCRSAPGLEQIRIEFDYPTSWTGIDASICTRIELGWNECAALNLGGDQLQILHGYVDPLLSLQVWILDSDGNAAAPLVALQDVPLTPT